MALAGDVAQHRGDHGEAEELEPHRVTSSPALARPWSSRAPCSRSRRSTAVLVLDVAQAGERCGRWWPELAGDLDPGERWSGSLVAAKPLQLQRTR